MSQALFHTGIAVLVMEPEVDADLTILPPVPSFQSFHANTT